jgi:hypothetical protein
VNRKEEKMQGKLQVRGLNPKQLQKWRVVLATDDPAKLDREADQYRKRCGKVNVQLSAILTRSEKTQLTRSVLERDKRKCRKCGNTVDVQVVSLRYEEYHNPDKLVTLCRICRHARKILLDEPFDEKVVRRWLHNGRTGIEELVEDYRTKYPSQYAEMVKQAGVEGAADVAEELIMLTYFGGNPHLRKKQSPQFVQALEEHRKRDPIPDAFLETDEGSDTST